MVRHLQVGYFRTTLQSIGVARIRRRSCASRSSAMLAAVTQRAAECLDCLGNLPTPLVDSRSSKNHVIIIDAVRASIRARACRISGHTVAEMLGEYPNSFPFPACLVSGAAANCAAVDSVWAFDASTCYAILIIARVFDVRHRAGPPLTLGLSAPSAQLLLKLRHSPFSGFARLDFSLPRLSFRF
jgi:hypothetical protein